MIHYSILPNELLTYDWTQKSPLLKEIEIEGVQMTVQMDNELEATIVRIVSMNPMDFFNPRFQPGNKVHFYPKVNP